VRHDFQAGPSRYEATVGRGHHDHLICRACGDILEFESDEIERLQETITRDRGFTIEAHRHELYGLCTGCHRVGAVIDAAGPFVNRHV